MDVKAGSEIGLGIWFGLGTLGFFLMLGQCVSNSPKSVKAMEICKEFKQSSSKFQSCYDVVMNEKETK